MDLGKGSKPHFPPFRKKLHFRKNGLFQNLEPNP